MLWRRRRSRRSVCPISLSWRSAGRRSRGGGGWLGSSSDGAGRPAGRADGRSLLGWMLVPIILLAIFVAGSGRDWPSRASWSTASTPPACLRSRRCLRRTGAGRPDLRPQRPRALPLYGRPRRPVAARCRSTDVSPYLVKATIDTEDSSFYSNPGINIKGLLRAAFENFFPGQLGFLQGSGGSSITQQLVKNLYIPESERQQRSISRKIKETVYAIELTNRYSKDQILEWYLNQISYGGVYNGVEAASQGYFGKDASDLTLGEAALLAGIPACPSCYDPLQNPERAIERRDQVLLLMVENGDITKAEGWVAAQEPLNLVTQRFPIEAPHWVLDYVEPELEQMFGHEAVYRRGLQVTTTLDLDLQKKAEEILEDWISEYRGVIQRPQRRPGGDRPHDRRDPGLRRQPRLLPRRHPGPERHGAGAELARLRPQAVHLRHRLHEARMGPRHPRHRHARSATRTRTAQRSAPQTPSGDFHGAISRPDAARQLAEHPRLQGDPGNGRARRREHGEEDGHYLPDRQLRSLAHHRRRGRQARRHGLRLQRVRQRRRHAGRPHGAWTCRRATGRSTRSPSSTWRTPRGT